MKIVINKCYGGFSLSHKAIMRYAELKGITLYPEIDEITIRVAKELGNSPPTFDNAYMVHYHTKEDMHEENYWSDYDIDRTDTALIQVVEELGEDANGSCANLQIIEIPDGVNWELDEYDGLESIHETHRSWS